MRCVPTAGWKSYLVLTFPDSLSTRLMSTLLYAMFSAGSSEALSLTAQSDPSNGVRRLMQIPRRRSTLVLTGRCLHGHHGALISIRVLVVLDAEVLGSSAH